MSASKESKQEAFEDGQKYESGKGPLIDLPEPSLKVWESNEDYAERKESFDAGRTSVRNNK
ncbi:MAG: hypothetical protein R3F50_17125 [Gammaproteobacteria bacterium]